MSNTIPKGIKDLDEYKNIVGQKTSALSNLNQANKTAQKYADTTALAQGYATQGARLQNASNLQNAYINQAGGINQNFQNQLGNLANTTSQNQFNNYSTRISNAVASGTLNQEYLNQIYNEANQGGLMQQSALNDLTNLGNDALKNYNTQESLRKTQDDETFKTSLLQEAINNGLSFEQAKNLVDSYNGNKIESQLSLIQAVEDNAKVQDQGGNATGEVNKSTGNTIYTSQSGAKYETNVSSGWHSNFKYTVGTKEFKVELGNKINDSSFDPETINVGEIKTYEKDGTTYLITKDSNGVVRYIKNRTGSLVGIDNVDGKGGKVSAKGTALYDLALALGLNPQKNFNK